MHFHHSRAIWRAHPTLAAGAIHARGITATPDTRDRAQPYLNAAMRRLDVQPVADFPEIQAWRRTFAAMGLKPTQYRCASESLLRRLHKDGGLPRIHPLVELCNHISVSTAIPIAAFDLDRVAGDLEVRPALGTERYEKFSGEVEHPTPGEVIFADDARQAHARRWTHRQSAASAIHDATSEVLIVAEALHDGAHDAIERVLATLTRELTAVWGSTPLSVVLTEQDPDFSAASE